MVTKVQVAEDRLNPKALLRGCDSGLILNPFALEKQNSLTHLLRFALKTDSPCGPLPSMGHLLQLLPKSGVWEARFIVVLL